MSTYVVVRQSPKHHQITLEEFLFSENPRNYLITSNETNTRTYLVDDNSQMLSRLTNPYRITRVLEAFNRETESLRSEPDRHKLYYTFHIPKKSGGLRRIDAPCEELMSALRKLKLIFEKDCGALYHTSAFAYVKNRSTIDAVKLHQQNHSRWFEKLDFHNFFGSTTLEFVVNMLSQIYPFSAVMKTQKGRDELIKALDLCFLDGVLPQGTPMSPTLTNVMMIPIDYTLSNAFRDFNKQRFVYTRYADDMIVSSEYDFDPKAVEKLVVDTITKFNAPFELNKKKTRYGSSSGKNWNLGLMLNGNNVITVGYKKKRQLQAMLTNFVLDKRNGIPWSKEDVMTMEGYRNYYRSVEGETIDGIVNHLSEKFGVDIVKLIKNELKAL